MATSIISWGLSLIFSGLLVKEMSRRIKGLDYRAAGAAAYLGLGAVWALGFSSSAALMMATKAAIPARLYEISGLIPLTQTLLIWPNLICIVILIAVAVTVAYFAAPSPERAKTAADFGLKFEPIDMTMEPRKKPGEWLEYSPVLIILVCALLFWYLIDMFRNSPTGPLAAVDLNNYNLIFIAVGMLLHWRPKRFLKAVSQSVPATGGVLIQFPFYAVIFGMIVGTGINKWLADFFVAITSPKTYSLLVAAYSAILGVFVPSGGSKWVIEAPYILGSGHPAPREHGMGRSDLQRRRSTAESAQPLLDASSAGDTFSQGARPGRLCRPAALYQRTPRVSSVLDILSIYSLRSSN